MRKWKWLEYIREFVFLYNVMLYVFIGYLLYFFMYGCDLYLFVDFLFGRGNVILIIDLNMD